MVDILPIQPLFVSKSSGRCPHNRPFKDQKKAQNIPLQQGIPSIVSLNIFHCLPWCMTLATSLDMNIELCLVHFALESALWQRLIAIKVELELVGRLLFQLSKYSHMNYNSNNVVNFYMSHKLPKFNYEHKIVSTCFKRGTHSVCKEQFQR